MTKIKSFIFSQKALALAILLVGVFGFFVLISRADQQKSAFEPAAGVSDKNKDIDGDGLANWEEELLGTNPYRADTDGDGFLDGEEVLSGHDPLIKGPDDDLAIIALDKEIAAKLNEPQNLTEALIQNTTALSLSPNAPADADTLATAIKNAGADEYYLPALKKQLILSILYFLPPTLKDSDLNLTPDNTKTAIEKYRQDLHAVFASEPDARVSDDQAILLAIQSGQFSQSEFIAEQWEHIYQKAKLVAVPSLLQDAHRQGLAAAYTLSRGFASLSDSANDPAKAILGLQEIGKGQELILDTFQQLALIASTL